MSYAAAAATFLCTFLLCNFFLRSCSARDYVTTLAPLIGETNETLGSAENKFVLGFFARAANRWYIGIWYSIDPEAVVWVANRDKPLLNRSHGIFTIDEEDGNLKLLDGFDYYYFSTNLSSSPGFSRTAKLLDTGNLVLINDSTGETLWQSFTNPTDTFLPGMKMDKNLKLTSWKNLSDPAEGNFTFQKEDNGFTILRKSKIEPYWKSIGTESSGSIFSLNKMISFADQLLSNSSNQTSFSTKIGKKNLTVDVQVNFTRLIMNFTGKIQYLSWHNQRKIWVNTWSRPTGLCGVYKACGVFGICNSLSADTSECNCFPEFEPISQDKWNTHDFSDGCKRKSEICKQKGGTDNFFDLAVML